MGVQSERLLKSLSTYARINSVCVFLNQKKIIPLNFCKFKQIICLYVYLYVYILNSIICLLFFQNKVLPGWKCAYSKKKKIKKKIIEIGAYLTVALISFILLRKQNFQTRDKTIYFFSKSSSSKSKIGMQKFRFDHMSIFSTIGPNS